MLRFHLATGGYCRLVLAGICVASWLAGPASAQTSIDGPSLLLSQAHADQLGSWVGQGPITIRRIFHKQGNHHADLWVNDGVSSPTMHGIVDGRGPTFTVIQAWVPSMGVTRLIGGYNPHGWVNNLGYRETPNFADRTAFIFDLTNNVLRRQDKGPGDDGLRQTHNEDWSGPTWGYGNDLGVTGVAMTAGVVNGRDYNGDALGGDVNNLFGNNDTQAFSVERMEMFEIEAVPEPGGLALFAVGSICALFRRRIPRVWRAARAAGVAAVIAVCLAAGSPVQAQTVQIGAFTGGTLEGFEQLAISSNNTRFSPGLGYLQPGVVSAYTLPSGAVITTPIPNPVFDGEWSSVTSPRGSLSFPSKTAEP